MPEMLPPEPDAEQLAKNYRDSSNKDARFRFYTRMYDYIDLPRKAIRTLQDIGMLPVEATVLDFGTGDGEFLHIMSVENQHEGLLIGLDRNDSQFATNKDPERYLPSSADWERAERHIGEFGFAERMKQIQAEEGAILWLPGQNVRLEKGDLDGLTELLQTQPIKVLSSMWMLYHLPTKERQLFLYYASKALGEDALFLEGTSGEVNKPHQRELETMVGVFLGATEPQVMNRGFTSEKAALEIPQYFPYYYQFENRGELKITDLDSPDADIVLNSLRSMRNQFNPEPTEAEFEVAIQKVVKPYMQRQIDEHGAYTDSAHRTIGIASKRPLDALLKPEHGFTRIMSQRAA